MPDIDQTKPTPNSIKRIEALLFIAAAPISIQQISETLDLPTNEVEHFLKGIEEAYHEHGISLQRYGGKYQFTTAADCAEDIERFLGLEISGRLSRAAVETMAIIAYRQPITRPAIDSIRGVSSDGVIKSLLSRGLIQEVGRAETPGRPILFSTTVDFLQHFGLNSIDELPPYEKIENEDESPKNGLLKD